MRFDQQAFRRGVNDMFTLRPLREWLWRLLPDECQEPSCSRQGVRGNENIIDGRIMCDYCSAKRRGPGVRLREPQR